MQLFDKGVKMKVRKATKKDLLSLTRLFNESNFLRPMNQIKEEEYNLDEVKDYLKKKNLDYFIVCEEKRRIIGALLAEFWSAYVHLHILIVDKKFRHKGVGNTLLTTFDKEVKKRKIKLIEVLVDKENSLMQKIMKKKGYKKGKKFRYFVKIIK